MFNPALYAVDENGLLFLKRAMDVGEPLIEADYSPEEYDLKWRAQNELKLKKYIDWTFMHNVTFVTPKQLNIHSLNRGLGSREVVPIRDTRFETLLDFLLFYEYVVEYPMVSPQKKLRQRWVGK